MDNKLAREFTIKFDALNADNQKYIMAIQQALMYAQTSTEKAVRKSEPDRVS